MSKIPTPSGAPNWYLQEWMAYYGMNQSELQDRTGWSWSTVAGIYSGKTEYYRGILVRLAAALNIEPFELLMPPDQAMQYRNMIGALLKVAEKPGAYRGPELAARGRD